MGTGVNEAVYVKLSGARGTITFLCGSSSANLVSMIVNGFSGTRVS